MKPLNLYQDLLENAYPGRGIVLGRTKTHGVIAYFIMGRSENSRNRVFVKKDGGIQTEAFDESKLSDPSLIIYAPVRVMDERTVVTNGDQTDTVVSHLQAGGTFEEALRTRTFEPDAPNYTPRISGLMTVKGGQCFYRLAILKSGGGNPEAPQRFFFEYPRPVAGMGHFLHTYRCDGTPIPSFVGEPKCVRMEEDMDVFCDKLWESLNEDNKVSLFVRYISVKDGSYTTRIFNKNIK